MANLYRMDLYRMQKASSFRICLILAFVFSLISTPLAELMTLLVKLIATEIPDSDRSLRVSELLATPLSALNTMLALISVCGFFYADVENGYIKNIAGQVPRKGLTVLSKFLVSLPHNLIFMLVSIVGELLGTLFFRRIVFDAALWDGLRVFVLKFLLLEGLCAILLLFTAALQSKALGTVFSVLFGLGLLGLIYLGIDAGLDRLFPKKDFLVSDYMPDQLYAETKPDTLAALIVSAVTILLFLWLSVRIFDRKDVK